MVITRTLKTGVVTRNILISSLCYLVICFRFLIFLLLLLLLFVSVFSLFVRFFVLVCFVFVLAGGWRKVCRGGAEVFFLSFFPDNI